MPDRTWSIDDRAKPRRAAPGEPMRFLEQAALTDTDECVLWPHRKDRAGYGRVRLGSGLVSATRIVLELAVGPPPEAGMLAAHAPVRCHNPQCVNPRHLRWASPTENSADRDLDGTMRPAKGEAHGMVKLTEAQVLAIRADQRPRQAIADDYGIGLRHVYKLKSAEKWAHL